MKNKNSYIDIATDLIPAPRLAHSKRVAENGKELAMHWKDNEDNAYLAGLIHDIAKNTSPEIYKKKGITNISKTLLAVFKDFPCLWHSFAAPLYIQHMLNIKNRSILKAVKWHTTGRGNMSKLEKIIYIADYIDPCRKISTISYVKELAWEDLNSATFAISVSTIYTLLATNRNIHPFTIQCHNYYYKFIEKKRSKEICSRILKSLN
ncbi:MAG: HD domain-containing protein [bacterium]|nr:HD domain-containing protein [bacterium]